MFSGIVEEVGTIVAVAGSGEGKRFRIGAAKVTTDLKRGDSVSVTGTCLTSVLEDKQWFEVEVGQETLRKTKLGDLKQGDKVNLERALKLSDRLGGHLVSGHVDTLAKVVSIKKEGITNIITFALDDAHRPYFIEKGSVAIDGVSLTVFACNMDNGFVFSVMLIPHTLEVTILGKLQVGDKVNIEIDLIAKYAANWLQPHIAQPLKVGNKTGLDLAVLSEHGYT
ncbi:MAG: riboflavin synthase [Candidatus Obscuribacterales bacterium]|nr:riboflavin synthase [Candidatus Obscuribacterales bacterium]